ncbi:MAG: NAD-glutamate dehydrogenase [Pseudomonadaceae bacterium]|nr:MAG: NAD-glutamate dehydrogenase [Pseudomonadaceae bacterium]
MARILANSKDEFLQQLNDRLLPLVSNDQRTTLQHFARRLFAIVPLSELQLRQDTDLLGCTLAFWRFYQQFHGEQEQLRVFNPDTQEHGWQSTHSIIQIIHPDSPFLVDSVRMALKHQGLAIHSLQNAVLRSERDAKGNLQQLFASGEAKGAAESIMHIEIDRCSRAGELQVVSDLVQSVLARVRAAVGDFAAMRDQLEARIKALQPRQKSFFPAAERSEVVDFLHWLLDDHFTFLGYERFAINDGLADGHLGLDDAQSLGVLRLSPIDDRVDDIPDKVIEYLRSPLLLSFAKASEMSQVHRPAYPDYVSIREVDTQGNVVCEHRFMGLYTSKVYSTNVASIPWLRQKVEWVKQEAGFDPGGHLGKELNQVLQVLPRDDLFQMSAEELCHTAVSIVQIQERSQIRLFLRRGNYGRFYYCLAYVPRELYSTAIRQKIQQVLMQRLQASECEFWTYFSESVLTRTQFILRVDPLQAVDVDHDKIEQEAVQACSSWQDDFKLRLHDRLGEAPATQVLHDFPDGPPPGYSDRFTPASGVVDVEHLQALTAEQPLGMSFYQPLSQKSGVLHCKLYHFGESLPLSDVLPILENLGLRVLGEYPFQFRHQSGAEYWIHDFEFTCSEALDIQEVNQLFREAFLAIWNQQAENDGFNRLVLHARMPWREVSLLRAYARYLKQIRLGFELPYIANTLVNHATIAHELVRLFKTRFYLARKLTPDDLADKQNRLEQAIIGALDDVAVLNEDRILRRCLDLIKATLRTNFYQLDAKGEAHDYLSFKLDPQRIPDLPLPRPMYEIFVYSPRFEGVHLRGGKVARGGLRWSDREEDYRTEVLGLVKAQQVKNAVIVPVGAKGGFVPRRLPLGGSRDDIQQEAIACYKLFIRGLLDLADNLVNGDLVPPDGVVRHDDDDPYLVVAADKGTATFSDIANEIAASYNFWLGDAFASGGSAGYDHKKMGITARGAWVSVQRHFREIGINVQEDPVTVVGIGDMAGDVFGNGLLQSRSLKLVAAFNHQHIFIDPDPDPEASFAERERLFALPRSSWTDYNSELISSGGGIFERSLKQIKLTTEMQKLLDTKATTLTPAEVINLLLKAQVDLIWNGGIGTYVKGALEQHADVGDKANDTLRINGRELRCKVIGEGGNLGMTQLGRIEFCLRGGRANTDFIDNAGGVDCSDHEVNIKILLNEVVTEQNMTGKQRNKLLVEMTEEVAGLVLANNYKQTQAISLAQRQALQTMSEYRRFISTMESTGKLDRALEYIADDEQLAERSAQGKGLTRPELSVLVSYAKADLKETLGGSDIAADEYFTAELHSAFPRVLGKKFAKALDNHRLRSQIIATQLANNLVNHMGITFLRRLEQSTGAPVGEIAKAYVVGRDVFGLMDSFAAIEALDYQIPAEVQLELMDDLMRLGRRATRWFIRNRRTELSPAREVAHFAPRIRDLASDFEQRLQGPVLSQWQDKVKRYTAAGVPEELARRVAATGQFYTLLGIIEAADAVKQSPERVAEVFFAIASQLQLPWFAQQVNNLQVDNHWQALARESYRDDLDWQTRTMAVSALQSGEPEQAVDALVADWMQRQGSMVQRWQAMLTDLKSASSGDYPMVAVAMRELLDLAQNARLSVDADQGV